MRILMRLTVNLEKQVPMAPSAQSSSSEDLLCWTFEVISVLFRLGCEQGRNVASIPPGMKAAHQQNTMAKSKILNAIQFKSNILCGLQKQGIIVKLHNYIIAIGPKNDF
jgi:hypothetical protein